MNNRDDEQLRADLRTLQQELWEKDAALTELTHRHEELQQQVLTLADSTKAAHDRIDSVIRALNEAGQRRCPCEPQD